MSVETTITVLKKLHEQEKDLRRITQLISDPVCKLVDLLVSKGVISASEADAVFPPVYEEKN